MPILTSFTEAKSQEGGRISKEGGGSEVHMFDLVQSLCTLKWENSNKCDVNKRQKPSRAVQQVGSYIDMPTTSSSSTATGRDPSLS